MRRRTVAPLARALAIASALALTAPAQADRRQCIADHAKGQELENASRLLDARALFLRCVSEAGCPPVIAKECADFRDRVDQDVPTLVFTAQTDAGQNDKAIAIYLDGRLLAERLDGRAHEVDPGRHEARFVLADGTERRVSIVAAQGKKNQQVSADFRAKQATAKLAADSPPAEPRPASSGIPTAAWVLGGVGAVALGSWAYFGLDGRKKQRDMEDVCAPYCPQSRADAMRRSYLIADVSLLVALGSLGIATFILLDSEPAEASGQSRGISISARVAPKSPGVWLSGTFDLGVD